MISIKFISQKNRLSLVPRFLKLLHNHNVLAYIKKETQITIVPRFRIYLKDGKTFDMPLISLKMSIFSDEQIKQIENRIPASYFSNIVDVKIIW